ncbi:MAG: hypothetical protein IPO98_07610 [Saprospiraceae bacterium]|nr:hypothetical protein [Saprospiraceae bacterium]
MPNQQPYSRGAWVLMEYRCYNRFITVGAGSYTVTITDANGCTATTSKNIANLPSPIAIIAGDTTVCNAKSTTITASGGMGYSWNTGVTTASVRLAQGLIPSPSPMRTVVPQQHQKTLQTSLLH